MQLTEVAAFLQRRINVHATSLTSPYRHVAGALEDAVVSLASPVVGADSELLDYGCANSPYRHLFTGCRRYLAADIGGNSQAEIQLTPEGTVPLPDRSFDLVLSTQVLEHVPDPALYLSECRRVLKPGGHVVITTHGIMYYHRDPEDYWRWTSDGLALLLTAADLRIDRQLGVMGLTSTAMQLFQDATAARLPRALQRPYIALMQQAIARADQRSTDTSRIANAMVIGARALRAD